MYEFIRKEYRDHLFICLFALGFFTILSSLVGVICIDSQADKSVYLHSFWYHFHWMRWLLIPAVLYHFIFSIYESRLHIPSIKFPTTIKMTFKQFRDIYNINPSAWKIDKYNIKYHYEEVKNVTCNYNGDYWTSPRTYDRTNEIYFNFLDWVRLVFWLRSRYRNDKRIKKNNLLRAQNESLAKMLINVQKDIDEAYKKMQEDIKE